MSDLEGMERRILTLEMEKSQNVEKVKERVKILATHTEPNGSSTGLFITYKHFSNRWISSRL